MNATEKRAALGDAGWRVRLDGKWISPDPNDARFVFTLDDAWDEHVRSGGRQTHRWGGVTTEDQQRPRPLGARRRGRNGRPERHPGHSVAGHGHTQRHGQQLRDRDHEHE
jgi:hypothetical protein